MFASEHNLLIEILTSKNSNKMFSKFERQRSLSVRARSDRKYTHVLDPSVIAVTGSSGTSFNFWGEHVTPPGMRQTHDLNLNVGSVYFSNFAPVGSSLTSLTPGGPPLIEFRPIGSRCVNDVMTDLSASGSLPLGVAPAT